MTKYLLKPLRPWYRRLWRKDLVQEHSGEDGPVEGVRRRRWPRRQRWLHHLVDSGARPIDDGRRATGLEATSREWQSPRSTIPRAILNTWFACPMVSTVKLSTRCCKFETSTAKAGKARRAGHASRRPQICTVGDVRFRLTSNMRCGTSTSCRGSCCAGRGRTRSGRLASHEWRRPFL